MINVSQLQNTKWSYLIPQLSEIIHQPFVVDDYHCEELEIILTPSNDIDFYAKLLLYFDRNHPMLTKYYMASIISKDQIKSGRRRAETTIPSTFSLSMREYSWIPIEGGRLSKSIDVYCLNPQSDTSFFRRYIQHLDQTKVSFTNQQFPREILGIQEHVLPLTILELFIQWSCGLDREILWTLINQTSQLEMLVKYLLKILLNIFISEFRVLNQRHSFTHVLIQLKIFVVFMIFFLMVNKHSIC